LIVRTGPTVVSMDGLRGRIVEDVVFDGRTVRGTLLGMPLPALLLRAGMVGIV